MSLFSNEVNSASYISGAILYKIPGIEVLGDGGPFSHLVLGHSVLHGLVAITAILGLCLMAVEADGHRDWRVFALLLLPAFAVPNNSVAALYILSSVAVILFWDQLRTLRAWLLTAAMFRLFLGAWRLMGFNHAADAFGAGLKSNMISEWWPIVIWFTVGLGVRSLSLGWLSRSLRGRMSVLVGATILELMSFAVMLHLIDDNERYGIYFLQAMLSIFAFSRMKSGFWLSPERPRWCASWLKLEGIGLLVLGCVAVLARLGLFLAREHTGIQAFGREVGFCFLAAVLCIGIAVAMKRDGMFARAASVAAMRVLAVGFLAWITPWLNFGLGRMKMEVSVSSGEVEGLRRLHELAAMNERFATNRHEIDSLAKRRQRSYSYGALSERPVLLEGYLDRGVTQLPWFSSMLHDNDLLFTSADPETLHRLTTKYKIPVACCTTWFRSRNPQAPSIVAGRRERYRHA